MHWQMLLSAFCVEFLGALVQGCSGIGLNLVAIPLLLLINPRFVPVATLGTAVLLTAGTLVRDRGPRLWNDAGMCLVGRVPGTFLGTLMLWMLAAPALQLVASASILVGVAGSMAGAPRFRRSALLGFGAGSLAAFFGTTAAVGGPPLALYYRAEPPRRFRALIALNGLIGSLFSLLVLVLAGLAKSADFVLFVALIPGLVGGFLLSSVIGNSLSASLVKASAFAISALSACVVGARAVIALTS